MIEQAKQGDEQAINSIIEEFEMQIEGYIRNKGYFLNGGEVEDLVQEGLITVYQAINDFDETKDAHFESFCWVCVKRQIIGAMDRQNRTKRGPLNESERLDVPIAEDGGTNTDLYGIDPIVLNNTPLEYTSPETQVALKDEIKHLYTYINENLSETQKNVFLLRAEGYSNKEIEGICGLTEKQVDNRYYKAKQRVVDFNKKYNELRGGKRCTH